ncbi:Transglutaminase-like superfamily protein [Saccharopolyspora antimicrobica]|uniref:Transglutaminase superfamily protein n=1 Tax=Saccharopolyspora antimicrobica TaxID=455193 RepID=A0A1I5IFE2_9PSEU|nr:lasso peptide biosynthesis B2 protein [Saccharopolyspora antimicrobica]RKT85496.1 transglutaminase superfamily protein [Saccharopolyspora antimicrobica]SFO59154.1 Transglutaminase-like superfamily protein [Saccharopolyspora antimicrobica]
MSTPETLFAADRPPLRTRVAARVAVAIALPMAHLSPRRIRHVLAFARRGAPPATYAQASAARSAVIAVSTTCAGKGCLPRSIATALLCRVRGCWPTWKVGVRAAPFGAHAWVEAAGCAVDEGEQAQAFLPLMAVEPITDETRKF